MNLKERINSKYIPVTESGCWLWTDGVDKCGYGRMAVNGVSTLAHRISAEVYGLLTDKKMHVCHKCDIPSCINPAHLFIGTHKDNMNDRDRKGRTNAKLNLKQVLAIRADKREYKEIAGDYEISISNISMIKTRKNWKHTGE